MQFSLPQGLQAILDDISRSMDAKLYYPAVLVALTVPEICAALSLEKDEYVKQEHYVDFLDNYSNLSELGLNSTDCYRLRGGVVHRANFSGHHKLEATHVIFTIPGSGFAIHGGRLKMPLKTALMLDLVSFCDAMVLAAQRWYAENRGNPKVSENLNDLIRLCPNGLPPFLEGVPVVASGA
ncbi:hypothetical protein [Methylorubrum sp. SL192]|uniref:hypothetical protein n=1 Tax=Methylorubrum sp. SL192 TaxID=2995167 RepID=UPI002272344F|nr:hypothetical protein [Methylorubrum sp. SL192]MCY1644783.1 hypothetical protein [Methylorubrum sp. SL192]